MNSRLSCNLKDPENKTYNKNSDLYFGKTQCHYIKTQIECTREECRLTLPHSELGQLTHTKLNTEQFKARFACMQWESFLEDSRIQTSIDAASSASCEDLAEHELRR